MFCSECGAQFDDGAKFCSACGASLAGPATTQAPVAAGHWEYRQLSASLDLPRYKSTGISLHNNYPYPTEPIAAAIMALANEASVDGWEPVDVLDPSSLWRAGQIKGKSGTGGLVFQNFWFVPRELRINFRRWSNTIASPQPKNSPPLNLDPRASYVYEVGESVHNSSDFWSTQPVRIWVAFLGVVLFVDTFLPLFRETGGGGGNSWTHNGSSLLFALLTPVVTVLALVAKFPRLGLAAGCLALFALIGSEMIQNFGDSPRHAYGFWIGFVVSGVMLISAAPKHPFD